MTIHVVARGETLTGIAALYGVRAELLARWNGLAAPDALAVGQSLLVLFPGEVHTVRAGQTLSGIARDAGVSVRRLWQLNPNLQGGEALEPGMTLVLRLDAEPALGPAEADGYAYPSVRESVLTETLPYAGYLAPFTYGIAEDGALVAPDDAALIRQALRYGVRPMLHLSTLTEAGSFSPERAAAALRSPETRQALIAAVTAQMAARGYRGVDVDFEYVPAAEAQAYAEFVALLREQVHALGGEVFVALAPKTARDQPGTLYEGHDYAALGAAADAALVMTYEWGYTYSEPMAVAPIWGVRGVLDFAVQEIPPEKLLMGFPNYGYDWTLPHEPGVSRARVTGNVEAVRLAVRYGAEIRFDARAQTPWFRYRDEAGTLHEVWFEDARSSYAKLRLIAGYGLRGTGIWNFMRPFPALYCLLAALYDLA